MDNDHSAPIYYLLYVAVVNRFDMTAASVNDGKGCDYAKRHHSDDNGSDGEKLRKRAG